MSEVEIADCSEAYKNLSCPYVTQININTSCMKQVDKALISLLGKDGTGLNDGVFHRMLLKLDDLKAKIMTRVYTTDGKNIQLFIKPM